MKKKLILILALFTLIVFSFVGCGNNTGASSGVASGLGTTSTVSGVMSSAPSGTQSPGNPVSGVISKVQSDVNNLGSQVTGTISGVASAVTSK